MLPRQLILFSLRITVYTYETLCDMHAYGLDR